MSAKEVITIKNLKHTPHRVASEIICPTNADVYEKKIESMAEDWVIRITRLRKRLDPLRLSGLSQKEKVKIQKWADQENIELLHLKETIREQKRSHMKIISTHDLIRLAENHPIWKNHYNLYMDQIHEASLIYEGDNTFIQCTLKPNALNLLRIFREIGDGKVLCVNSDRGLLYADGWLGHKDGVRRIPANNVFFSWRELFFRTVERIRVQWVFTGDEWGLNDHILWLNFGTKEEMNDLPGKKPS